MRPNASICRLSTPPAGEPVSLAEAKAHLRVDGADEDALITTCIIVARDRLEQECRRAFMRQQWTAYIKYLTAAGLPAELPRPNLLSGVGNPFVLESRNSAGTWNTSTAEKFAVQDSREPALLWLLESPVDVDTPRSPEDAVFRATYWTGYGETASSVPQPIRHAILLLVAHLFENREMVKIGSIVSDIPKSLDWLIAPYKVAWEGGLS